MWKRLFSKKLKNQSIDSQIDFYPVSPWVEIKIGIQATAWWFLEMFWEKKIMYQTIQTTHFEWATWCEYRTWWPDHLPKHSGQCLSTLVEDKSDLYLELSTHNAQFPVLSTSPTLVLGIALAWWLGSQVPTGPETSGENHHKGDLTLKGSMENMFLTTHKLKVNRHFIFQHQVILFSYVKKIPVKLSTYTGDV